MNSKVLYRVLLFSLGIIGLSSTRAVAADGKWPMAGRLEIQPVSAATERLIQSLDFIGAPLNGQTKEKLSAACQLENAAAFSKAIQEILDPFCLVGVVINAESRVTVVEGPAKKELVQQGWRTFLVKVHNEAGVTSRLVPESPNLLPVYQKGSKARERPMTDDKLVQPGDVPNRFLDAQMFDKQPQKPGLSGLELEYRIVQLYSRDTGHREAQIGFNVGQGTQDLGFRNSVPILFQSVPATEVKLSIKDVDGSSASAALTIRDSFGRVYPNPARRLAPDFFFHDQIYRSDGETISLPPGDYTLLAQRGPEYLPLSTAFKVPSEKNLPPLEIRLKRWIHCSKRSWFSGDHHVHAAGCAHYDSPTEGVTPTDMLRHIVGEDLNVGCVLSWGPCWYTQKRYFEGKTSALSRPDYLMRYDVEISGFPSSHAGHLCLLNLREDDYPETTLIEQWPSWTLPILQWGKQQGGVVGYSHSGWGLALPDRMPDGSRKFPDRPWGGATPGWTGQAVDKLPDEAMPRFDSIGANEFIVTTAHDACDFISTVDTPSIWELNIWYHTLNCGMRTRISGETDFPCIYGDKLGLGRIYVKLPLDQPLTFENWIQGVKDGRSYCGDGLSHLFDFSVNGFELGLTKPGGRASQIDLAEPGLVKVTCDAAALLAENPTPETDAIRSRRLDDKPYWHIERTRIGDSRTVPVELIVNGIAVDKKIVRADGSIQKLEFNYEIKRSSWIALRILPSCHTNPIFIEVGGKPIRASRSSAEWCARAVDVCWNSKSRAIRQAEREAAKQAYDKAREIYQKIANESE